MAKLDGSGAVVMLSGRGAAGAPTAIAQATAEYGLPVILTDTFYANMGEVIATARHYSHLYIETNHLSSPRAVDIMVGEIGAHRLLYGSAAPEYSVQRALNEVLEAGLTDEGEGSHLGAERAATVPARPGAGCRPAAARLGRDGALARTDH